MPTYQYACKDCDHTFEQVQSFTDDALSVCPSCNGRLRKVFNAVGVVFKGSGFYRTDSRAGVEDKNGSESKAADDKPGEKPAAAKSGEKSAAPSGEKQGQSKSSPGSSESPSGSSGSTGKSTTKAAAS